MNVSGAKEIGKESVEREDEDSTMLNTKWRMPYLWKMQT